MAGWLGHEGLISEPLTEENEEWRIDNKVIAAAAEFVQESSKDQSKSAAAMEQKARYKVYKSILLLF